MQQRELTPKERFVESISGILFSLRYVFMALLLVLLVFVVTVLIYNEVRSSKTERSTIIVERIEDDLSRWADSVDEEFRQTLGVDLISRLDSVVAEYPRLYAAQRGLFLLGRIYYGSGAWEVSVESFVALADRFPNSYLAPIALINASSAKEEAEDTIGAIALLERVAAEFDSPELPTVRFSLGRLNEQQGNIDEAIAHYEELLDDHPASGWTNIARSRIIALQIDRS